MGIRSISIKRVIFVFALALSIILAGFPRSVTITAQEVAKDQAAVIATYGPDLGSIDPISTTGGPDMVFPPHIFGSLVRHPVGDSSQLEFQPDLAEKWVVSADKLSWTFHLRKGVKWHWGYGELTSEDVLYSLNRVSKSSRSAWRGYYTNFKEVKATDRYTVQIVTKDPDPFLLTKVANFSGGFILCKKALEKMGDLHRGMTPAKEEVVGTGPFKFVEYKPKDRVILERNEDYWEGKPVLERLIIRFIPDDGTRTIALLKGEIAGTRGVDDGKWIKHMKSNGVLVEPLGPTNLKALYFNLKIKPFDDRRIREAFAYGTSQESIFKMQGEEISAYCTSPVPSGLYGHIDAGWAKYKRDPEKAKKLLAEAGYPKGLTVKSYMSMVGYYLDKMIVFQNELKECGIDLDMAKVNHTEYLQKIYQGANPVFMWGDRHPLATDWLRNRYHGQSIIGSPGAIQNYMFYSNPEVDSAINLAERSFDDKARLDALAKAQRLIVQDLPGIGVIETRIPAARNAWFDLGYQAKNNLLYNYQISWKTRILKH